MTPTYLPGGGWFAAYYHVESGKIDLEPVRWWALSVEPATRDGEADWWEAVPLLVELDSGTAWAATDAENFLGLVPPEVSGDRVEHVRAVFGEHIASLRNRAT